MAIYSEERPYTLVRLRAFADGKLPDRSIVFYRGNELKIDIDNCRKDPAHPQSGHAPHYQTLLRQIYELVHELRKKGLISITYRKCVRQVDNGRSVSFYEYVATRQ